MSSQSQEYLLFAGDNYYPLGGWDDYEDTFSSLEEAKSADLRHADWAHIVFDNTILSRWSSFDGKWLAA